MTDPEYGAVHHLTVTDYATPAQYRKDIKTWARLVLEDAAQIREQVWP